MNSYYQKFLSINKEIINSKNDEIKEILKKKNKLKYYEKNFTTLLVSRDREFQIFLQSFLASALSQKKKTGVTLISEKPINNNLNQILFA